MLDDYNAIYLFFYVKDMDVSRRFYEETLGLSILELEDRAVKYDTGEIILALNLASDFSIPVTGEPDRSQLIVFHVDDLDRVRQDLESRGVTFTGPTDRYEIGATAAFFDPDGHCLMLYEPSEESMTWPSGEKYREILRANSREHTILRVLQQHQGASPGGPGRKESILGDKKITYIFQFVDNAPDAFDFYSRKLGLKVLEQDGGVGVVKYDGGGVLLATHLVETQTNAPRQEHLEGTRSSALVFYTPDIHTAYQNLQGSGISFDTDIIDGEIGLIARFRGPNGHTFYLYEPSSAALSWPSGAKISQLVAQKAAARAQDTAVVM